MNVHAAQLSIDAVVQGADRLGETPLWCDRTQRLWWLDVEQPKLQSYDPSSAETFSAPLPGTFAGAQALTMSGGRLLAHDVNLHVRDLQTGHDLRFVTVEHSTDTRLNDGRVDARGRFWVGTMDNALHRPIGNLYRIDPDRAVTKIEGDVIVANGIAFAPDARTLYFTDTRRNLCYAYDLDLDDGVATNKRIFADHSASGERPDGACVDVDGCIWMAFFAGARIVRYCPDGRVDRIVPMPVTNPTCLCFGGPDLRTLYVTSATKFLTPAQRLAEPLAGSLFAIDGLGQGLPEHRFGST